MHIVNLYNRGIFYSVSGMCQYWNKNYKTNRMSVYLRNICPNFASYLTFFFSSWCHTVYKVRNSTENQVEPNQIKYSPQLRSYKYIYTFWVVVSSHSFFFCSTYSWSLFSMQCKHMVLIVLLWFTFTTWFQQQFHLFLNFKLKKPDFICL